MNTLKQKISDFYKEQKTYVNIAIGIIVVIIAWKMFKK